MTRYFAFISYSHSDSATARWLHKSIEAYRLPRGLRGEPEGAGREPRLTPVFLDRAELATATGLAAEVQRALEQSERLIVVCSPAAASSRWVKRSGAFGRSGDRSASTA
jgi:hypothetical protein